jgi:hypothetical protein
MSATDHTAIAGIRRARWVARHWWSRDFHLISAPGVIISAHVKGSRGIATIGDRRYRLQRLRPDPFVSITIRDERTDELIAKMRLAPERGGLPAELANGDSFRLGWTRWWKRQWAWTDDAGERVLLSQKSWFGRRFDLQVEPAADSDVWPLLAVLQLAIEELAKPWF